MTRSTGWLSGCPNSRDRHADARFAQGLTHGKCAVFVRGMSEIADAILDGLAEGPTRPEITARVTRGAARLLLDMGCAVLTEMRLANGRRADLVGLCPKGIVTMVEIKSCREDYEADGKWQDYLPFCDRFYFATDDRFPSALLPEDEGRIVADGFGGAILREAPHRPLVAARRKAMTLRFARQAAFAAFSG